MIHSTKVLHYVRCLVLFLLIAIFCPGFSSSASAGETGDFTGTWIANGTRQVLPFGKNRNFYTFKMTGHVNLKQAIGGELDFWSEIIGISDSKTGSQARCVWTDLGGRKLFLELKSDRMQSDELVMGKIVGGTGKFVNATGTLSFKWSSMSFYREGKATTISGQTFDLKGSFQLGIVTE